MKGGGPNGKSLIRLEGISRTYRLGKVDVPALANIELVIDRGDFLVVHGPSGSGKTTLLNIIGCLDKPNAGRFELDGVDLTHSPLQALAPVRNQKIGFIFQSFNLIPVLNVAENIEFPCLIRKNRGPRAELRRRAEQIAADVGLGKFLLHRPDELSGGQRQRVAIARALITDPVLVLADEPTANLDSGTSLQILGLMQRLNQERGVTFVFSTHDSTVMGMARRKVSMRDGLIQDDTVTAGQWQGGVG